MSLSVDAKYTKDLAFLLEGKVFKNSENSSYSINTAEAPPIVRDILTYHLSLSHSS